MSPSGSPNECLGPHHLIYLPVLREPLRLEPNAFAHRTAGISLKEGIWGGRAVT